MGVKPQVVETSADLLSANLCTFQFVNLNMSSPNFNRIEGMSRSVETIEQADGGSGLVRTYHGGVVRYEEITVVRVRDNTVNDRRLSEFVTKYAETGEKEDAIMIKRHHGQIIRRVEYIGLGAYSEQLPSYDNLTAAPEEITYPMHCDFWEEVF